jgi:hypothetical protein
VFRASINGAARLLLKISTKGTRRINPVKSKDIAIQMRHRSLPNLPLISLLLVAAFAFLASPSISEVAAQVSRTPSDTVREFYKALREKRFREALSMSIYKPAIEELNAQEFDEYRPYFEAMAVDVPEKVEINGEQISGEMATVFVNTTDEQGKPKVEPVKLQRVAGVWIIGNPEDAKAIKQAGKNYFFNLRIQVNHNEAQNMLLRIAKAQFVYGSQHKGEFADIPTLVKAELLPSDVETSETTGYRYMVTLGKDRKSYTAGAVPSNYGRTGRLSFHLDQKGLIKSSDTGGKPYVP